MYLEMIPLNEENKERRESYDSAYEGVSVISRVSIFTIKFTRNFGLLQES